MGNMSYCRFENTSKDLMDCQQAIVNGETEDLNDYEVDGLRRLLDFSKRIVDMESDIEEAIRLNEKNK
jgi:hypothetical protein